MKLILKANVFITFFLFFRSFFLCVYLLVAGWREVFRLLSLLSLNKNLRSESIGQYVSSVMELLMFFFSIF